LSHYCMINAQLSMCEKVICCSSCLSVSLSDYGDCINLIMKYVLTYSVRNLIFLYYVRFFISGQF